MGGLHPVSFKSLGLWENTNREEPASPGWAVLWTVGLHAQPLPSAGVSLTCSQSTQSTALTTPHPTLRGPYSRHAVAIPTRRGSLAVTLLTLIPLPNPSLHIPVCPNPALQRPNLEATVAQGTLALLIPCGPSFIMPSGQYEEWVWSDKEKGRGLLRTPKFRFASQIFPFLVVGIWRSPLPISPCLCFSFCWGERSGKQPNCPG